MQIASAQEEELSGRKTKDYKDSEQHQNFYKRRNLISIWQINELRKGAIVVRLKTNQLLINSLRSSGRESLAVQKELEAYAINKNTMFAYIDKFRFCKVYFLMSNLSDSLLNGARAGIFLDTSLKVDPKIEMKETFYLLADKDYGYNSSIGFVPEDSASKYSESGNAVRMMTVILKNKYGHQLKAPFPYRIPERSSSTSYDFPISYSVASNESPDIHFYVDKTFLQDFKDPKKAKRKPASGEKLVNIKKTDTYEKISEAVAQLSYDLGAFFKANPPLEGSQITEDLKPFLY